MPLIPDYLRRLELPNVQILRLLYGKVEVSHTGYRAVEGGALFGVPDQDRWWVVIHHSLLVRRVAIGIATWLNDAHHTDNDWGQLDLKFIGEAALLEDFAKRYEVEASLEYPVDHVQAGLRILQMANIPHREKLERVLITHIYGMEGYREYARPMNWTEKIFILADHYVTTEIVSLGERFADFRRRQGEGKTMPTQEAEFWRIHDYCYLLQQELLNELRIDSEEGLVNRLKALRPSYEETKLRTILRRQPERAVKTLMAVERLQRMQNVQKAK